MSVALERYFSVNRQVQQEHDGVELPITGTLPEELIGTLFRNGNGCFERLGLRYDHFFDGDGMITSFAFDGKSITYRNRYVRTQEYQREEQAGKPLYRSFGTNLPGGFTSNFLKTQFKNAANTSIIWHGGKLLALWEGGLPHLIDPHTLQTLDRYTYDGMLDNDFGWIDHKIAPELPFSAHPKQHVGTGNLYNFGTAPGTKQRLLIYEVDPAGKGRIAHAIEIPEVVFTHDFIHTEKNRQAFFLTPVAFGLWRMFLGLDTPVASMKVRKGEQTKILLVKDGQAEEYFTDFCFIFHYANGFDLDDDRVAIDAFTMSDFPDATVNKALMEGDDAATPRGYLIRYEVNRKTGEVSKTQLSDYPAELPSIHPDKSGRPYRYVWGVSAPPEADYKLLDGIAKIDIEMRQTQLLDLHPNLPGEPLFVPRPGAEREDDGWLLFLLFDVEAQATDLKIARADNLEILASARLPESIPLGFHGTWVDQLFGI